MIVELRKKDMSTGDLADSLGVSKPTVYRAIGYLRGHGLQLTSPQKKGSKVHVTERDRLLLGGCAHLTVADFAGNLQGRVLCAALRMRQREAS